MEKSKVLWLDVDGVLLDWTKPFLEYIKSPVSYDKLKRYDLSFLFDGDTDKMANTINEFNKTRAYAELKPLVSREDVEHLKQAGYELRVITQVDGHTQRFYRLENLTAVFGPRMFSVVRFTKRGEKKAETLRKLEPYDTIMIVEDNPAFFEDARRVGGFEFMAVEHPYNRKELRSQYVTPIYTCMAEIIRDLTSRK